MSFVRFFICLVAMSVLAACADSPAEGPATAVLVAPDLTVDLPRPGDLGRKVEADQLVTARYGGQTFSFEGRLSATGDRFLMVGCDPMGRELLRITWTPAGVDYARASWVPSGLRAENMLADIVLLYWPADVVRHALASSGGTLSDDDPYERIISVGGREMIRADYQPSSGTNPWSGRLHYRNLARGYELDIQSREVQP